MLEPIDLSTSPPGGWQYTEPATGVKFRHNDPRALMKLVGEHRRGNDLPTHGDWVQQVYHLICVQNPTTKCHDVNNPERVWLPEDIMRFLEALSNTGTDTVSEEEQLRRIAICKGCPKNGFIMCRYCGPLAEYLTKFLAGRNLPKVEDVYKRSCLACGCDITSKTAYPVSTLQAIDHTLGTSPEYHSSCWMLEPQT